MSKSDETIIKSMTKHIAELEAAAGQPQAQPHPLIRDAWIDRRDVAPLTRERDELRAEVERLRAERDAARADAEYLAAGVAEQATTIARLAGAIRDLDDAMDRLDDGARFLLWDDPGLCAVAMAIQGVREATNDTTTEDATDADR